MLVYLIVLGAYYNVGSSEAATYSHSSSVEHFYESRLDSTNLYLRRDLTDKATQFFQGLSDMLVDGDLNEYIIFAHDILTDNFIFPSDVTGVTYYGLDKFLDETNGWHVNIIGTFDTVTNIMGSNIIYKIIDNNKVEMKFHIRTVLWRNECPSNGIQGITEEEVNILTFIWSVIDQGWRISSYIGQGGKFETTTCSTDVDI